MLVFILATTVVAATFWMLFRVNNLDPYASEEMRSFMIYGFAVQRRMTKLVVLAASLLLLSSSAAAWVYELTTASALVAVAVSYLLIGVVAVTLKAPKLKFNHLSSDPLLQALALVPTWPVWLLGDDCRISGTGVGRYRRISRAGLGRYRRIPGTGLADDRGIPWPGLSDDRGTGIVPANDRLIGRASCRERV